MGNAVDTQQCCGNRVGHTQLRDQPMLDLKKRKFKELKKLGVGASCSVLMVEDMDSGTRYALKKLPKNKKESSFLYSAEADILRQLKHDNILEYVGAFEDKKDYKILTVLCQGGELFDRVSAGSFSEADAARLTKQMLLALQHCHHKNITHRDLKPENFVFVDESANSAMKLIDFGCAKKAADDETITDVAGSPYYVAPEVLEENYVRTGAVWKAADMWSIGVIIYLLVHGYPPFNGNSQREIFESIRRGKYRYSKKVPLSKQVKDLIGKLLKRHPRKRLTVDQALEHEWFAANVAPTESLPKSVCAGLKSFHEQLQLKKAVGKLLVGRMTEDDKEFLQDIFKKYDTNGDGKLSPDEIAVMLQAIGHPSGDAQAVLEEYDDDHSGAIEFKEFSRLNAAGALSEEKKARDMFAEFDQDGDGKVTVAEIEAVLGMKPAEVKKLVEEVDVDGDGEVDLDEWMAAMAAKKSKL